MKLDFIKTFGQKIVFYIIVCAAVTTVVTGGTFFAMSKMEHYLISVGYRSVALGPDGMRPATRMTILILMAVLTFSVTFYLLIRNTVHYINEIVRKIQDISAGDFEHPIAVRGNDEFAVIAENLNILQKNIKQIMERERIAEHTKNDLISSVAHDLRTPLTSIIGYLGWVRTRKDLDRETQEKYLEIAYDKAIRLEQLTNELFGFVKLEHKEMKLHTGNLDLIQLMEQMLDEMTPSFVKNELDVQFRHDDNRMIIEADGELLARLFGNLLSNAVKYGKEGKQISITMNRTGNYVVTRVTNYGRVIPKSDLEHIFMKFYRTEQSRSRDTGGTGLGLAIVQQIVELHHGKVMVKSDLQGTVFEVELPIEQPKEELSDEN